MRKRYLFLLMLLFPLATILSSSRVHAQTDAEYDAAMAAIRTVPSISSQRRWMALGIIWMPEAL